MSCKLSDKCDNVFACNVLRPNVELLGCNFYKPKQPMTNEEWLKSLNTDEFADFLEGVAFDSNFRDGIEAEYRREDKDYCYGDRPKIIKAWLKEVHNAEKGINNKR